MLEESKLRGERKKLVVVGQRKERVERELLQLSYLEGQTGLDPRHRQTQVQEYTHRNCNNSN